MKTVSFAWRLAAGFISYVQRLILLKRSLDSVARISLYIQLQTPADSERIDRFPYNFSEDVSYMTMTNF